MVNIVDALGAQPSTSALLSVLLLHFHHHQHFSSFHFYYNNKLWTNCVCKAQNYVFVGQMLRAIFCVVCFCFLARSNRFPPLSTSVMTRKKNELLFKFMINRIGLCIRHFASLAFFSLHCPLCTRFLWPNFDGENFTFLPR